MDSITQALIGAVAAHALVGKKLGRKALVAGAVAGILPDLDILIRSSTDPTYGIYFHRHFTHSLIFVPVGALIAFLFFRIFSSFRKLPAANLYLACFFGYLSHAPLDVCTSFGTLFFWPFSMSRVAIDWISIIDPVYTGVLFFGFIILLCKPLQNKISIAVLLLSTLYLFAGGHQHHQARIAQQQIINSRGDKVLHSRVMPTFANVIVWRSVYRTQDRIFVDTIRIGIDGSCTMREGGAVALFSETKLSEQLKIINWFADGFLGVLNESPRILGDLRYGSTVMPTEPFWGWQINDDGTLSRSRRNRDYNAALAKLKSDVLFALEKNCY